jgi:N-acetylmuramoyl-L-alanine amidase
MKLAKKNFLAIVAVFILAGCATTATKPELAANELILKDLCEASNILLQWDSVARIVTLSFQDRTAKFLVGSDVVLMGDEKIYLGAPTRIKHSVIIVSNDFKTKVIEKLRPEILVRQHTTTHPFRRVREVIIDPGHGGKDPGALGRRGTREKDIVLDVARRVSRLLEREGVNVQMTRRRDEFISLQERTEIACRSHADLFVSIHANSSPVKAVSGMEIYSLRDLDFSEKNEAQRKANMELVYDQLQMKKGDRDLDSIVSDMLYAHKREESVTLASQISRDVPKLVKNKSRGTKEARFYVLRNTMVPSVLVEIGFLTNPQEEKLLRTPLYRQKLASALANSIVQYVRSKR